VTNLSVKRRFGGVAPKRYSVAIDTLEALLSARRKTVGGNEPG
jgi:hypothetical protein